MANQVTFIFKAIDKYTAVGRKIAMVNQKMKRQFDSLRSSIRRGSEALKEAGKKLRKFGKSVSDVGKSISLKVSAPAAAFAALSIRNFDKQEKAIAKVNAALKSTGMAAGLTFKQLNDEAQKLQKKTLFGDENILNNVTAPLLTFTNIAKKNFLDTQVAIMDVATLMEGDLKSATIQLGKALNDPVANLGALGRTGIQFSEEQKATIKTLSETNQLGKAQGIILREIEKQYGGMAQAAALAGTGPLTQLRNIFGDLTEEIGRAQFEVLRPMIKFAKELTEKFKKLSPSTKKALSIFILILAVLGPIVFIVGQLIIGMGVLAAVTAFLGTSVLALLSPFLLVVAAIGLMVVAVAMIISRWEDMKAGFFLLVSDIKTAMVNLATSIVSIFTGIVDTVVGFVTEVSTSVVNVINGYVDKIMGKITAFKDNITNFVKGIGEQLNAFFDFSGDISTSSSSTTDVNVNLVAPEGTIKSIKSKTSGKNPGLNIGINMANAL